MNLWLTRIRPAPTSSEAARDLAGSGQGIRLHKRLLQMFPDDVPGASARKEFGVLFRVEDADRGLGPYILMQSQAKPDPGRLPGRYGTVETRSLDTLLGEVGKGAWVHYRCVANPVRKPSAKTRELYGLKPVVPLNGSAAVEWWERQAASSGLEPQKIQAHPLDAVTGSRGTSGEAARQRVHHARTRFDGTARVTDPALLRERLAAGIGRGKAYGCGLLTIALARSGTG